MGTQARWWVKTAVRRRDTKLPEEREREREIHGEEELSVTYIYIIIFYHISRVSNEKKFYSIKIFQTTCKV